MPKGRGVFDSASDRKGFFNSAFVIWHQRQQCNLFKKLVVHELEVFHLIHTMFQGVRPMGSYMYKAGINELELS